MTPQAISPLDAIPSSPPRLQGRRASGWALTLCLLMGALATGCHSSDAPQETPDAGSPTSDAGTPPPDGGVLIRTQAEGRRPNLMLMVDTSGSMNDPINPKDPQCQRGGTVCGVTFDCNPSVCPTRWSSLGDALSGFLTSHPTLARVGLTTFPGASASCTPGTVSVELPLEANDDDDTLRQQAQSARAKILSFSALASDPSSPRGGTPTGPTLRLLESRPELQSETFDDFVLLVSDGAPNCNDAYPYPYPDSRCACTLASCESAKQIGCTDRDNTVDAVRSMRAKGIKTFVIGFGSDVNAPTAEAQRTLQIFKDMAAEGGTALAAANTRSELDSALEGFGAQLAQHPCVLALKNASSVSQDSLAVSLDGQVLTPGADTWSLTGEGVRFSGTSCQRLQAATREKPVSIQVSLR